jgi:hypothetical protein
MTDPGSTPGLEPSAIAEQSLDWRLFLVVSLILIAITALFVVGLFVQWSGYNAGLQVALTPPVDHGAALSYSRGLDAAIVKSSALFLGYLLVFTGALYVLRSSTAGYQLSVQTGSHSGTLQTASPGLVIITLGVLLIVVTILTKSKLDYVPPPPQQQEEKAQSQKGETVSSGPESETGPPAHKKAPQKK